MKSLPSFFKIQVLLWGFVVGARFLSIRLGEDGIANDT